MRSRVNRECIKNQYPTQNCEANFIAGGKGYMNLVIFGRSSTTVVIEKIQCKTIKL